MESASESVVKHVQRGAQHPEFPQYHWLLLFPLERHLLSLFCGGSLGSPASPLWSNLGVTEASQQRKRTPSCAGGGFMQSLSLTLAGSVTLGKEPRLP